MRHRIGNEIKAHRRFRDHKPPIIGVATLPEDHPAVVDGHTRYPAQVRHANEVERVFKSGAHNRKIGSHVTKGPWRGMPIYTLTLEERATCPKTCRHWRDCFGNKMHWSKRLVLDPALEDAIEGELWMLNRQHRNGFVVRLHVLGDFETVTYVRRWMDWIERFPALHVYGYTANLLDSPVEREREIAREIDGFRRNAWGRFAIRFSNGSGSEMATRTLYALPERDLVDGGVVCPAQTGKTACCGTCGLCWGTKKNIVFIAH